MRCLVRDRDSAAARELEAGGCELAVADLTRPAGLEDALDGVEAAYFLVHMIGGGDDYPAIERAAAGAFRPRGAGGRRRSGSIYLGGLGDDAGSKHLAARHDVADALRRGGAAADLLPRRDGDRRRQRVVRAAARDRRAPAGPARPGWLRDRDAADRRRRRRRLSARGARRARVGRPGDPDRRPGGCSPTSSSSTRWRARSAAARRG